MSEFFAMGGYAFYVWGSYLVAAVIVIVEVTLVRQRHRSARRRVAQLLESRRTDQ
jgi:heme exporter protein D